MRFKKIICGLLAVFLTVNLLPAASAAEDAYAKTPPPIMGNAYIVMDADTGQVLIEHNADERRYPASITKIMTMGLALEKAQGQLDTELTVGYDEAHSVVGGSTIMALTENEVIRLEDVLYGTELVSANDGANVLATYVGGSMQGGVDAMNAKAEELGMTGTHYVNAHGLHDPDHYTTARDMATVTRWALQQPEFKTIFCRSETWEVPPTNKQPDTRYFSVDDRMRIPSKYYRSYAKGSKSGYTEPAGRTLVTYAEQDDIRLISVVLGCPFGEQPAADAGALLDYCYASFSRQTIETEPGRRVPVAGGGDDLGSVQIGQAQTGMLLHRDTPKSAVKIEYDIPEQLVLGKPFSPTVTFTVDANAGQAASSLTAELSYTGLEQVLEASTYVPESDSGSSPSLAGFLISVTVILLVTVVVLRLRALHLQKKRREAARRARMASGKPRNGRPAQPRRTPDSAPRRPAGKNSAPPPRRPAQKGSAAPQRPAQRRQPPRPAPGQRPKSPRK